MGQERSPEWYDDALERSEYMLLHHSKVPQFDLWNDVAGRVINDERSLVLDIGCGTGQFAEFLVANSSVGYVGVDFSPKRVAAARRLLPHERFECYEALVGIAAFSECDIVVMLEFLEHVEADIELIRCCHGRRILASVPNYDADAHVRHFADADAVRDRYGAVIDNLTVDTFEIAPGRVNFLIDGIASGR